MMASVNVVLSAVTWLTNPRRRSLTKHHTTNAGDGQDHGQHIGLAEALGQQAKRASYARSVADQAALAESIRLVAS